MSKCKVEAEDAGPKAGFSTHLGFCFSQYASRESENLLGAQSMFGTIGSLVRSVKRGAGRSRQPAVSALCAYSGSNLTSPQVVGAAMGLLAVSTIDETNDASARFMAIGHPWVATMVQTGAAWSAAISSSCAMITIVIALSLYVSLCLANMPEDQRFDGMSMLWVKRHYFLIAVEFVSLIAAVLFLWAVAFFVGVTKFDVSLYGWAAFGWSGMMIVTFVTGYVLYIHITYTVPAMRAYHVKVSAPIRVRGQDMDVDE